MVYVFTICVDANEAFGFRLVEERRRSPTNPSEVEVRTKVGAIRPSMAQSLRTLMVGDVLFQVGYKGQHMKTWQWELVTGFGLEDVMAAISEAKTHDGVACMRFFRPERKPEDGWTSSFGEDLLVESSIKREDSGGERKMGDSVQEPSSVRVGVEYQCDTIPVTAALAAGDGSTAQAEPNGSHPALLYSCNRISAAELEAYLGKVFGVSEPPSETFIELALHCLHECDYRQEQALEQYTVKSKLMKKEWTDEQKAAFETAMSRVGCRDFRAVQYEMTALGGSEQISIGDIVSHYYAKWKSKPGGYEAWLEALGKMKNPHPRKCYRCGGDDPYLDAIKCSRCPRHCHLECLDPPMVRVMQSATSKWANWLCENCARPPSSKATTSTGKHVASSTLRSTHSSSTATSTPPPPTTLSASSVYGGTSRRSAAAAATNYLAATQIEKEGWGKRGYEDDTEVDEDDLEDDDDEDDYESGSRRRGKRSKRGAGRRPLFRADTSESGPKIHHLKGTPIPVEPLIQIVADKGGFDAVVTNKLWQVIRKEMNLPHTTSSSTQLREAYLAYSAFFSRQRGEVGQSLPPPPPPPGPPPS